MKRLFGVIAAVLTLLASATPAQAHHSAGYHWRRNSNPVTVRYLDNLSPAWSTALSSAASQWDSSDVIDTSIHTGSGGCGQTAKKVNVCNKFFSAGWAGLTQVSYSPTTHHISAASIKFNDRTTPATARAAVACHEMGHSLGLAHRDQSESTSCMTPTVSSGQTQPDSHDYAQLDRIYHHLDGRAPEPADQTTERTTVTYHNGLVTVTSALYLVPR